MGCLIWTQVFNEGAAVWTPQWWLNISHQQCVLSATSDPQLSWVDEISVENQSCCSCSELDSVSLYRKFVLRTTQCVCCRGSGVCWSLAGRRFESGSPPELVTVNEWQQLSRRTLSATLSVCVCVCVRFRRSCNPKRSHWRLFQPSSLLSCPPQLLAAFFFYVCFALVSGPFCPRFAAALSNTILWEAEGGLCHDLLAG